MSQLPVHSHHRAPLVSILAQGLPSTTAAPLLHTSASYVRECKRKDVSQSALLQDKYARGVKRAKLHESRLGELMEFLVGACPVKSGSRSETMRQFVTDEALYEGYRQQHPSTAVCFNTFLKYKRWLRVKHAGKYLGMFDCPHCFLLHQLPSRLQGDPGNPALLMDLAKCKQHQAWHFRSAISTC